MESIATLELRDDQRDAHGGVPVVVTCVGACGLERRTYTIDPTFFNKEIESVLGVALAHLAGPVPLRPPAVPALDPASPWSQDLEAVYGG